MTSHGFKSVAIRRVANFELVNLTTSSSAGRVGQKAGEWKDETETHALTRYPDWRSWDTMWDPRKPEAPVTCSGMAMSVESV